MYIYTVLIRINGNTNPNSRKKYSKFFHRAEKSPFPYSKLPHPQGLAFFFAPLRPQLNSWHSKGDGNDSSRLSNSIVPQKGWCCVGVCVCGGRFIKIVKLVFSSKGTTVGYMHQDCLTRFDINAKND